MRDSIHEAGRNQATGEDAATGHPRSAEKPGASPAYALAPSTANTPSAPARGNDAQQLSKAGGNSTDLSASTGGANADARMLASPAVSGTNPPNTNLDNATSNTANTSSAAAVGALVPAPTDASSAPSLALATSDTTSAAPPTPASQAVPSAGVSSQPSQNTNAPTGFQNGWLWLLALLALLLVPLLRSLLHRRPRDPANGIEDGATCTNPPKVAETKPQLIAPSGVAEPDESDSASPASPATASVYRLSTRQRPSAPRRAPAQVVSLPSRRGQVELEMGDTPIVQVLPAPAAVPPASQPAAPEPESEPAAPMVDANECLAEAKRRLTANQPTVVLQALQPLLAQSQVPAEAWVIAGWAHWRIAQESSCEAPMDAATSAARAFEQALRLEPERGDLLTRLARCHLLRAEHATGNASRAQCLDQALAQFSRRSELRSDQAADQLEVAQTLMLRGRLAGGEARAQWLARAGEALGKIPESHPVLDTADARHLRIDLQLALAEQSEGAEASRRYADAIAVLSEEVARADAASRDGWLLKLIDAARERIQRTHGAGRLLQLQAIKTQVAPYLLETEAVAPLLSWINLLDDWAGLLHARAAQVKLAEADSLFERVAHLPALGQAGIQFARAYYLRLRARYEHGATQLRTLEQALERLNEIPAHALPENLVQLERAEIQLRMGRHLGTIAGEQHLRASASAALQAAGESAQPEPAWVCAAFALSDLVKAQRLSVEEKKQLRDLCQKLENIEPGTSESLRAAALIRLLDGEFAASSALCERAWRSGAGRDDILPLWREADERWAETMPESSHDPHWRQLHQRMRLASSSH